MSKKKGPKHSWDIPAKPSADEIDYSNPQKAKRMLLAKKWNESHQTVVSEWGMDAIYAAPPKPNHINRAPNQLTKNSPRHKNKSKNKSHPPTKKYNTQTSERNKIKQSKESRFSKDYSPRSYGVHFVSGGLVRPK